MELPARALLLLAVSSLVVASDPPPPSDIQPNFLLHNVEESNSTTFKDNVARAYTHLFNTVPTKGPTQYMLGSGSDTVYSYGQCYNISGKSCHSCLNATAMTMGTKWLGARFYTKGNDFGCFIRYESYEFDTGLQQQDPPPPSDIQPNFLMHNVEESNSTIFKDNVARAYTYLLNTVPTKGPTQHMLGSGSGTVYSYAQCYNISGRSCHSCLNATAMTMGTKWLGARFYTKGNDSGCFIRYESYKFDTGLHRRWPSSVPPAMSPVSPSAPPSGAIALVPPPQRSGGRDAPRDVVTSFLLAAAILCLNWT